MLVKFGVQLNVPVPLPLSVNAAPVGRLDVERPGMVPSGSEADTPKVRSARARDPMSAEGRS